MNQVVNVLNPITFPLFGERLIEASAGTGKTFTISLLYLRLLLGLGEQNSYYRPLSIEEILVVTFTDAASTELRERIREIIHELRLACINGFSNNLMIMELLKHIIHPADASLLLLNAEYQMDKAAIFTIHGFCRRILNLNILESGVLFEHQLIEDEEFLIKEATNDFWRRHFYPLTLDIAKIIAEEWSDPEQLFNTLLPWFKRNTALSDLIHYDIAETFTSQHKKNLIYINDIKRLWLLLNEEACSLIINSHIDQHIYNSKYLNIWINKISYWAQSNTDNYHIPSELTRFSQITLEKETKKGIAPYHKLFLAIDKFLKQNISLRKLIITRALKEISETIQKEKQLRSLISFNDLLNKLNELLQKTDGNQLAEKIRQKFPVALIDEFQDTDRVQYNIFRKVYMNQPAHTLIIVGDPKQAIYSFRGSDIFTYIHARNEIKSHFTLNTNWRSSPKMVQSINKLFSRVKLPFILNDIPFLPVQYSSLNEMLTLTLNNKVQAALRFWVQPGEGNSITDYYQYMAQQCAMNINYWLQAGQQKRALLGTKKQILKPIQASDITVLVRNRKEGNLIRDALNQLRIPSIYLSNRDSVYATSEANELLYLLQAILSPENKSKLCTAMSTSLFGINALKLEELIHNIYKLHEIIDIFYGWYLIWQKHGILAMIRKFIIDRQLIQNLLSVEDSERRVINLLHLGELLQEITYKINNPQALTRYLARQISCSNNQLINHQVRVESDSHLVQIITIHKSKGLQYPLVWLPFACAFQKKNSESYNYYNNLNPILNLKDNNTDMLSNQNRLAEDLRLLYVALTRSIYHCNIG
ncbi:exodeoxyribonuclease V subunit beta, partial [Pantoea sp. Mhis]|uniref:exodeoxyribonuclease V subunit beta n=1 Tax=Pantoea sp. Mhis TaxID=2576759 RepID=UPI001359B18F